MELGGRGGWGATMERKEMFWEANQENPASQICSCGIKIGIKKTREQKCTSHFASLLRV